MTSAITEFGEWTLILESSAPSLATVGWRRHPMGPILRLSICVAQERWNLMSEAICGWHCEKEIKSVMHDCVLCH